MLWEVEMGNKSVGRSLRQVKRAVEEDAVTKAANSWIEFSEGLDPARRDVERIAKKFGVKAEDVMVRILELGIEDGWLVDDYFQ